MIELRAGTVGMASGKTFTKLSPRRRRRSMFGVRVRLPKTASARSVSTMKRTTFGPSGVLAKAAGSSAAVTAAPADAWTKRLRVSPPGTRPTFPQVWAGR